MIEVQRGGAREIKTQGETDTKRETEREKECVRGG